MKRGSRLEKPLAGNRSARGQIRIIGGSLRRTPLPVAGTPGLRPTPDRVRETVFNWLGDHVRQSHCLDLFAGTGALGLEAASRGAAQVVINDRDAECARSIESLLVKLKASSDNDARRSGEAVRLVSSDALSLLRQLVSRSEGFDLVFLDPPFSQGLLSRVLPQTGAVVRPGGLVYVESDQPFDPADPSVANWTVYREGKAGQVHYYLLKHLVKPEPV